MSARRPAKSLTSRYFLRLALIGAMAASLGLAACGRKGPLDPPPGASLDNSASPASVDGAAAPDSNTGVRPDGLPVAGKGERKRIPLDVLLN